MSGGFLNSILAFIEKHSVLFTLIGAIFGSIVTIIIFLFRQIKSFITSFSKWAWRKLQGQGKDHDFEKAYLDWLIRENRHLGLLPAQLVARRWKDRQRFAHLEEVYVNLSISTQSGDEHWGRTYGNGESTWRKRPWIGWRVNIWLAQSLLQARYSLDITLLPEQTYQPGDLGLVVDRHKRLIIRGDPGSGKTTLLKYLAVTCARTLRNNRHDGDSPNDVKKRLLWTKHPFPILVRLRRYGDVIHWDDAKELTATILGEMRPELRKQCPPGFFEQRLLKGNCLILLDAFDELGTPDARAAMARKIAGFLEIYKRNDNRIVVTTRIVGYENQLDQYDFTVRTLHNLQAGEIRALVKQRYNAIALAESALRPDQEARDIEQNMRERAERLIEKIESTPRLNQLATNPMLLSLIVLVHSLKIELPDERLLLYRDCVEILAESWQQFKREEAGIKKEEKEELSLNQKLILLRELAFAMQRQRKDEGSPALMPKDVARDIIARKLPDFLASTATQNEQAREEIFHKADAWIAGIQEESGILVEQGLDEAGEPLIGFSHLTFQEYLAAIAIYEEKTYLPIFKRNLLQPAWQEVVLLYTALTNDATPTINALLTSPLQPQGILLAGKCLGERLKKVNPRTQQLAMEKLKEGYSNADDKTVSDFGQIMSMLRENEITTFMRQQLNNPSLQKQLAAIIALGQTRTDAPEIEQVRSDLAQIVETSRENTITISAREALARIGDPRFRGPEPVLVRVPAQPQKAPALMRTWKDLSTSPEWKTTKKFSKRRNMLVRVIDYWLFNRWSTIRRRQIHGYEFELAKYPVTNIEYRRFIMATGHRFPLYWKEETFPREEATHPVVGITKKDAVAYCKWLSHKTGNKYRLPTQWEWEWAAAGPQGWKYPWGDQFDKDRCNTEEANIERTTPVGGYLAGNSLCGASDMIGNVWEINLGSSLSFFSFSFLFYFFFLILFSPLAASLPASLVNISFLFFSFFLFLFFSFFLFLFFPSIPSINNDILRGGAWNTSLDEATCFYWERQTNTEYVGFRCLKEINPIAQLPSSQTKTV